MLAFCDPLTLLPFTWALSKVVKRGVAISCLKSEITGLGHASTQPNKVSAPKSADERSPVIILGFYRASLKSCDGTPGNKNTTNRCITEKPRMCDAEQLLLRTCITQSPENCQKRMR